jgi:hypothetical protein
MNKLIDNKVKMESVELDALDVELKVVEKIKYTELKTGNFFIVRKFKDGLIKSNTFIKEQVK